MRVVAESGRPLKKGALRVLIASVGISALLGVWAMLASFGEFQLKVLFTAMTVAGASIIALACGAALELGRARLFAPIGIWASVIGGALALIAIWFEVVDEGLAKVIFTSMILAVFGGHASALSAANVLPRQHWIRVLTVGCTALVAILILWFMWVTSAFEAWVGFPGRLVGTLIVLASAGTIMVPVLARMGRDEFEISADAFGSADGDDIDPGPLGVRPKSLPHCPHCGEQLPARLKQEFP